MFRTFLIVPPGIWITASLSHLYPNRQSSFQILNSLRSLTSSNFQVPGFSNLTIQFSSKKNLLDSLRGLKVRVQYNPALVSSAEWILILARSLVSGLGILFEFGHKSLNDGSYCLS